MSGDDKPRYYSVVDSQDSQLLTDFIFENIYGSSEIAFVRIGGLEDILREDATGQSFPVIPHRLWEQGENSAALQRMFRGQFVMHSQRELVSVLLSSVKAERNFLLTPYGWLKEIARKDRFATQYPYVLCPFRGSYHTLLMYPWHTELEYQAIKMLLRDLPLTLSHLRAKIGSFYYYPRLKLKELLWDFDRQSQPVRGIFWLNWRSLQPLKGGSWQAYEVQILQYLGRLLFGLLDAKRRCPGGVLLWELEGLTLLPTRTDRATFPVHGQPECDRAVWRDSRENKRTLEWKKLAELAHELCYSSGLTRLEDLQTRLDAIFGFQDQDHFQALQAAHSHIEAEGASFIEMLRLFSE